MNKIRFISDLHFGHKNMAIRRGFKDEFEHDEYIIKQWNSVVNKRDTVFILGDITMERSKWYFRLDSLFGYKKVILGNHDKLSCVPELLKYVNSVGGMLNLKNFNSKNIVLTHCPVHPSEFNYKVDYNIHGHVHENTLDDKRYINVSAEVIDYKPKTFEELNV